MILNWWKTLNEYLHELNNLPERKRTEEIERREKRAIKYNVEQQKADYNRNATGSLKQIIELHKNIENEIKNLTNKHVVE